MLAIIWQNRYFSLRILCFFSAICHLLSGICSAAVFQLFIEAPPEAACNSKAEVAVYALDEQGRVDATFEGRKRLILGVAEQGGERKNSFRSSSDQITFQKGVGYFHLQDSEPETLQVRVDIEGVIWGSSVTLSFEDKDIQPPQIEGIGAKDARLIALTFNEELEAESAQDCQNYLAVTNKGERYPASVEYHKDRVILKFDPEFADDEEGYIELGEIQDLAGNTIPSGTRSPEFEADCGCD